MLFSNRPHWQVGESTIIMEKQQQQQQQQHLLDDKHYICLNKEQKMKR